MNREEILAKAQQEGLLGLDDGSKHVQNRGRLFGRIALTLVYIVITIFSFFTQTSINQTANAMYAAFLTGEFYFQWREKRSKVLFLLLLGGILTTIGATISVIIDMFGK